MLKLAQKVLRRNGIHASQNTLENCQMPPSLRTPDNLASCISPMLLQGALDPFCGLLVSQIKRENLRRMLKFERRTTCILGKRGSRFLDWWSRKWLTHRGQRTAGPGRRGEERGRKRGREGQLNVRANWFWSLTSVCKREVERKKRKS